MTITDQEARAQAAAPSRGFSSPFLFSIDLEPFYFANDTYRDNGRELDRLLAIYLETLRRWKGKATFFVVGDVAREHPSLLEKIVSDGHELACHGDHHLTLDKFSPKSFAADLRRNRASVAQATGQSPLGFRAPLLSITPSTSWAYRVLRDEGFEYSSSVLAAKNPLYGWPEFGTAPRMIDGVHELGVTLMRVPVVGNVPLLSGTYFRVIPWWFIRRQLAQLAPNTTRISYFHPYDVDAAQGWGMHTGVKGSVIMNSLLFLRRKSLPGRISKLLAVSGPSVSHINYIKYYLA